MTTSVRWILVVAVLAIVVSQSSTRAQFTSQDVGQVRIAPNDVLVSAILKQLQTLNANLQVSAATRAPVGNRAVVQPIGQVMDALKVAVVYNRPDPCGTLDKGNVAISQTATTRLVQGLPGQRIFVCAARVVAGVAEIPSFIEGTGSNCGTGTTAVSGSTTAANGESYAANGGFAGGNGGGSIMVTNKPGDDLCLQQSGANRLAGNIVYAFGQP
jgi:hypothetical protein